MYIFSWLLAWKNMDNHNSTGYTIKNCYDYDFSIKNIHTKMVRQ